MTKVRNEDEKLKVNDAGLGRGQIFLLRKKKNRTRQEVAYPGRRQVRPLQISDGFEDPSPRATSSQIAGQFDLSSS